MSTSKLWIMIPARGGSTGLPRKNVRLLAGLPLISHVIRCAIKVCNAQQIIVITDDDEIATIAEQEGVNVTIEQETTGNATLDDVALKVINALEEIGAKDDDYLLTLQPTTPLINHNRITEAVSQLNNKAGCVITVVDDRHLGWNIDKDGHPIADYKERLNRQKLPKKFKETGGIIGCQIGQLKHHKTRIIRPIKLVEVSKQEAVDIDDFADWSIAEYYISRRKIVIRADANNDLGMGHVFRAIAIAQELARHYITLVTNSSNSSLGSTLLSKYPFELIEITSDKEFTQYIKQRNPDLVILDQLDTRLDYIKSLKKHTQKIITLEDQGPGALEADLVISDLYSNLNVLPEFQLTGISNAILAPNFETLNRVSEFNKQVQNILLIFGGTDPSHLTEKTLNALSQSKYSGHCSVVLGPGFNRALDLNEYNLTGTIFNNVKYMPKVMITADLAISSAGRTITELTSLGIPVLCLCQNEKELTHTHASAQYGVINLGLGKLTEVSTIKSNIEKLVSSHDLRKILRDRALHETATRSNSNVIKRVLEKLDWNS